MESNFLLVTNLPNQTFDSDYTKESFEGLFKEVDCGIQFEYFKSFCRVRLRCSSAATATTVRNKLNGTEFMSTILKISIAKPAIQLGSRTLGLPAATKQFLISPPSSPPVGWEQSSEQPPVVNYELLSAVFNMSESSETYELHQGCVATPSIIVSTPDGDNELSAATTAASSTSIRTLPVGIVNTPRPPL